ncbi:SDR family oxidoreductase [Parvularcula sp. LCG005]|uniref:SDR family oxidoreductase n=1 Tax=Parvularcula sp. LCG005 TaxID=3078805 RepID=UPI002942A8F3|nr:SDR family oxidoreductase [Parvularcula sp. LCG005]WOI52159.1 SDR family oxidoreductase [Parvularcula sp. LCG005]
MSKRLAGKRALITAAAQGIGLATAERFAAEGAEVIATDVNAQGLSDHGFADAFHLDVTSPDSIAEAHQRAGNIDILFNCAGWVHAGAILETDEDAWSRSCDINVTSMYRMIRTFLPGMISAGGGSIINMSSVASSIKGVPNRFAYSVTKAAVIGMTKAVAADYVDRNIRCNAICPGTIDTPSLRQRLKDTGDYEAAMKAFVSRQPMGRLGKAEEIAGLATYLASDDAAFVTGTSAIIDGAWSN